MSGNHYRKHVLQLEAAFKKRVAQLRVLEAENARLKQKEWALQSCILAFEGSVAATKAVLEANDTDSDAAVAGASDSLFGACNAASYSSGESPSGSMQSGPQGSDVTSCSTAAQAILQTLKATEQPPQATLAQLGGSSNSRTPYSTRVLRKATADPAHLLSILQMSCAERQQYIRSAVQKMGLLLPKYDSRAPSTSLGCARGQLHALVDELSVRTLVPQLLGPTAQKLSYLMVNLETMQPEHYPAGYWAPMAVAMKLTDDQKAALKMCWARVRASKGALTEQHSKLSARLQELQQQQEQRQQQFEAEAVQLPVHQLVQRLGKAPEARQQQQQQPLSLPAVYASSQNLAEPGSMQMQQLEEELQEVERMLFAGLEGADAAAVSMASGYSPAWSGSWSVGLNFLQDEQQQQQPMVDMISAGAWSKEEPQTAAACMPVYMEFGVLAGSSGRTAAAALQTDSASTRMCEGWPTGMIRCPDSDNSAAACCAEEVLLVSWKEQQEIEQQLAVITGKMKMLHFCQELQFYNVLTYKQIAEAHINAWPFVPDALSVCEALDELDWP